MDRRARIDERIKNLLTSTDLTFKQIIEKLRSENMPASFNTIRRVNRNHRYRKPRYDAKLTPSQRKELIVKLKNTTRPNLSSLARQYGVCHGSIWYWWDKLSKIREKNGGLIPKNEPTLEFDDLIEQEDLMNSVMAPHDGQEQSEDNFYTADPDSDPLDLDSTNDDISETIDLSMIKRTREDQQPNNRFKNKTDQYPEPQYVTKEIEGEDGNNQNYNDGFVPNQLDTNSQLRGLLEDLRELKPVGPVQARNDKGDYIRLPIMMYASAINTNSTWTTKDSISGASSSSPNSTPSTSSSSRILGSLSQKLGAFS